MFKRIVSTIMLTLTLTSILTLAIEVHPAKFSATIHIRSDGSIDPPGVPISTIDNVTYTFTADIYDSIVVERDNITVDGSGYSLIGPAAEWGINLTGRENITVKNMTITLFTYGVYLDGSSNINITGNMVTANSIGIYLKYCSINMVSKNHISDNDIGISLFLWSTNNTFSGNNVTGNNNVGIHFGMGSNTNSIFGNNIANNGRGLEFCDSDDNTISGNNITSNGDGIKLHYSSSSILGNNITNNENGIYAVDSDDNNISGNNITANNGDGILLVSGSGGYGDHKIFGNFIAANNGHGIVVHGHSANVVSGNFITTNTGRGIYAQESFGNSISGNNITNNSIGIYLADCSDNNILGNNITNNVDGIAFWPGMGGCRNNNVFGNNITENSENGVFLCGCLANTVSGNSITENNGSGIYFLWGLTYDSKDNNIFGNNIRTNQYGIRFDGEHGNVDDNSIHHNNFVNNAFQTNITNSVNAWDDGYPSAGNYWGDYTDIDQYGGQHQNETGNDGVWDHPYTIDANNQDRYPLVNPLPRDIAVINVTPSEIVVNQDVILDVNVTVANQGASAETFNVTLCAEPTLAGYWKFDEGSGTIAYDSSGYNNTGTISGAGWTDGKGGKALQFDGIDDYVEVPHSASLNLTNTGSITAWIKIPSVGAVDRGNIINKGGGWNRKGWMLTTIDHNRIRFHWQSAADKYIDSQLNVTYDEWHHIAAVMDGSTMKIYIDGVQDSNTLSNTDSADTATPIMIGRSDYYGHLPFNGTIDEVRAYSMVLGEEDIRALAEETGCEIQTQTVTLENNTSTIMTFTWNTTGFGKGIYTLSAYAPILPGETDTTDNIYIDGTVRIRRPVHNLDTGLNYTTIQAAIDAPETLDGHTIFVEEGIYYENVVVNKSLSLVGENESATCIDGSYAGNVVTVTASNVTITGFTISKSESSHAGICLFSSNNSRISGNIIIGNKGNGTFLLFSSNNVISENFITHNGEHGIVLDDGTCCNSIEGNIMTGNNGSGIYLIGSDISSNNNNTISDNDILANGGSGVYLYHGFDCEIVANNITSNSGSGIVMAMSTVDSISQNIITHNDGDGQIMLLFWSHVDNIYGNYIVNGQPLTDGILISDSSFGSVCANVIENNNHGICFGIEGGGMTICNNNITNNEIGISIHQFIGIPHIYHNNFVNNADQIPYAMVDVHLDDGYPSGGNYWSDYTAVDNMNGLNQDRFGGDGIGDTQYVIELPGEPGFPKMIDRYPLINPWPGSFSVTLISPLNRTYYSNSIPVTFRLSKPASWIGYSLDNQPNVTINSNTVINVDDGPHQIVIYANDTSGNVDSSNIICFAVNSSIYGPWETSFIGLNNYPITDLTACNGNLYSTSHNLVYVYDGEGWGVIEAPTHTLSLECHDGNILVAGKGGVYSFNETGFTKLISGSAYYKMLGVYNNTLYAGTYLDSHPTLYYCTGSPDNPDNWHVDTAFSTILNFSGPFGSIDSFAVYNSQMYVSSGGTLYSFNGIDWSVAKIYYDVYTFLDMQVYDDKLYLATRDLSMRCPQYQGGSGFCGRIIRFDGANWTTVLSHDYWIYSLEISDGMLYAGTANRIFALNGTDWELSFSTTEGSFYAISMTTFNNSLYVGMGNGYIFANPSTLAFKQLAYRSSRVPITNHATIHNNDTTGSCSLQTETFWLLPKLLIR